MASTNTTTSDNALDTNGTSPTNGVSHTNGTSTSTTTAGTDAPPLPVVIAGGGCVGLFLALLLTQSRIPNPIIIIEPETPDPTSTRAMAHQPPTYPILSRVPGLLPELVQTGSLSSGLCFRTSVANGSRVIAGKTFDNSGEGMKGKGQLLLPQGKFQAVLMRRLSGKAEIKIGYTAISCEPTTTTGGGKKKSVNVTITTPTGTQENITAAYLVDASGSHSTIRKNLGIKLEGETLDTRLVAMDVYYDFHAHNFYDANFIIDPLHYGLIGRINHATPSTPTLWRVSYGVPRSMSDDEIKEKVDDKLRVMMPNGGRNEAGEIAYKVERIAPYLAQQRLADTLYHRENRTCLVGDAAHLTNPYAALGLASGMADAASLAEVLVRVLMGEAEDGEVLLGSWAEDRRSKFWDVVDKPSRMAFKRVKSDVRTEERVQELMDRDPLVAALKKGMRVQPPSLETKGEELEGW